jgi:hypothetical protein
VSVFIGTALREVRAAVGNFLRGFVGVASRPEACNHEHVAPTPASAREALSSQAARRGRCC